ncbi:hypothetical protein ACOSP7_031798 [Xanthoceras sorbifolium]
MVRSSTVVEETNKQGVRLVSKYSDWNNATASWGKKAEDTTGAKPWSAMGKLEVISTEPYEDAAASWGKNAEDTTGAKPRSDWGKQEVPATEASRILANLVTGTMPQLLGVKRM